MKDSFVGAGADLVICCDADDPTLDAYKTRDAVDWVGDRTRIGPLVNKAALHLAQTYKWVGFAGDDHVFRTAGWSATVDQVLGSNPGVAYGNDLFHGEAIPTSAFMSSEIITALGYMHAPGLWHLFMDNCWKTIGEATSLTYLPDMIIEHMHPQAGKGEWDDSYRANNSGETWEHDATEFQRWLYQDWPTDRQRL